MERIEFFNRKGEITFSAELPTSWDEVTEKQFKRIFKLLYSTGTTKPEVQKGQLRILELLLNPKRNKKRVRDILNIPEEQMYDLLKVIDFIFNTFPSKVFIPSFRIGLNRYYLPDNDLNNASILEYTFADTFLSQIPQSENEEALNKLVATLCRPSKWFWSFQKHLPSLNDGDRREKFNSTLMVSRAETFKRLPAHYKFMVFYFFVGCKIKILKTYDQLFPAKKEGGSSGSESSWLDLIQDVAKTNLYGNYDQTAFYNLHTILHNLNSEQKRLREKK